MTQSYLTRAKVFDGVLVDSTGAVTSVSLRLKDAATISSIVMRAASVTGAADVKLEYITSPDDTNYEAVADTQDITASSATDKTGGPELFNSYMMPTAPENSYIKFIVTGVGGNPADTIVDCYVMLREGIR